MNVQHFCLTPNLISDSVGSDTSGVATVTVRDGPAFATSRIAARKGVDADLRRHGGAGAVRVSNSSRPGMTPLVLIRLSAADA
jgi:hypothetical protein